MVFELVFPALIAFTFLTAAAYVGTLRALEVYFDPTQDSYFLMDDSEPPEVR